MKTLKEILEQAEALPQEDQKNLALYFVLKFISPDSEEFANFILQNIVNDNSTKQNTQEKRAFKKTGSLNLEGRLDSMNIREFAYE